MMGKFANIKQIIGDSAHNVACFHIIKKLEGLFLNMSKQLFPHIGFNINAQFMAPIVHHKVEKGT